MEEILLKLAEYFKLPIGVVVCVIGLWMFFKESILNEIKKQTELALIEAKAKSNIEVLTAIENQKAKLKEGLNLQSTLLEKCVLTAIESQKAEIQKDLNKQIADFQIELTRYTYLKEEEIIAYKILYSKLLKTYYKFRNYTLDIIIHIINCFLKFFFRQLLAKCIDAQNPCHFMAFPQS